MTTLLSTSQIIKKYNLAAKKTLGQNFIIDQNFTDKIVKTVNNISEDIVLEIGPGAGSLSRSILDQGAKKLISVEKDQRCIIALGEIQNYYQDRFSLIEGDALEIDELKIIPAEKFRIIANLPYNIGTNLIFKWLKIAPNISSMTLMLQLEVAQRICAKIGDKNYGRLAVTIGLLCQSRILFQVKNSVFTPKPKVTSAVIEIIPRERPLFEVDFTRLEKVVACAFSQRRKMIRSSLKPIFGKEIDQILTKIGIDPDLRAQNLSIEDFCKITNCKKDGA